jgi:hypothetical protein
MDTKTSTPAGTTTAFPMAAVEAALMAELLDFVKSEAAMKGYVVPATDAAIIKAAIQIDSLVTVDILCTVEAIIGFELSQNTVRTGGYKSIDAAIEHLLPRIQKQWAKKYGVKT